MFQLSNNSTKSKYYGDSNELSAGEMKDQADGVGIKELIVLKLKMYSSLLDDSSEH